MAQEPPVDQAEELRTTEGSGLRQLPDHGPSARNTVTSLHHCLKRKRTAAEEAPSSEMSMNPETWRRHLDFPEESMMAKRGANSLGDDNKTTCAAATAAAATYHEGLQTFGEQTIPNSSATTVPTAGSVIPTLVRHVPDQYSSLRDQAWLQQPSQEMGPNTSYCYRHDPDLKCRRQADESSMQSLQKELESLSHEEKLEITRMWSAFSAASAKHRKLMLQGILAVCCFSQLSYLSTAVRELVRIDFLAALPAEISYQILSYLDPTSLCKAAQVSRRWKMLADDDVVWHRMCQQHIDRKCTKCGWGLPLIERKRLRASKRTLQLRKNGLDPAQSPGASTPVPTSPGKLQQIECAGKTSPRGDGSGGSSSPAPSLKGKRLWVQDDGDEDVPGAKRRSADHPPSDSNDPPLPVRLRPWKSVYRDRFKVCANWKYGRCSIKTFRGHRNGVMCLQFDDNTLATGSYDATIKIWDIRTGEELRTLTGHEAGIRALQFDDRKLISGGLDHSLRVWNWHTGECISTLVGHSGGVICLHFEKSLLASGSVDGTIKIWNFETKGSYFLRGHHDWVNSVKIHGPSNTLLSASDDLTVRLWDLNARATVRIFEGHVGQVQQVTPLPLDFEYEDAVDQERQPQPPRSPDSGTWTSPPPSDAMSDSTTDPKRDLKCDAGRPDPPRYMLTGALDSTVRLWNVATGECLRTFFGHVEGIWALAADTVRIVSGSEDRMVKVWDARSGKCERTFTGHRAPVTCIGLSDTRLCTGSEDSEVRLYSFGAENAAPEETEARIRTTTATATATTDSGALGETT